MQKIDRGDMLELTRRMTVKRNCFHRIAGAYLDADGFIDGTFNIHFQKLSLPDQEKNLKIAKAIPFSETNEELIVRLDLRTSVIFQKKQKSRGISGVC